MFKYKGKEAMEILNMGMNTKLVEGRKVKYYEIEDMLSVEEKIAFIDRERDGVASYMLALIKKWNEEKDTIPKDKYGEPRTVSKKAWFRKNDSRKIVDIEYTVGNYWLFKTEFKSLSNICPYTKNNFRLMYTGQHIVHQWFHDLIGELVAEERRYYKLTDTKQIKLTELVQLGNRFGVFNCEELNDIVYNHKEDVAEEKLDEYIDLYKELSDVYDSIEKRLQEEI